MKKLFLTLGLILSAAYVHADLMDRKTIDAYTSNAVYMSSITAANSIAGGNVLISTTRAVVYGVWIASAGIGLTQVELFDSRVSTGTLAAPVERLTPVIDGRVTGFYPFNAFASSGIAINVSGGTPPQVGVYYQDRK